MYSSASSLRCRPPRATRVAQDPGGRPPPILRARPPQPGRWRSAHPGSSAPPARAGVRGKIYFRGNRLAADVLLADAGVRPGDTLLVVSESTEDTWGQPMDVDERIAQKLESCYVI